jgi:hypothetical protein
MRKFFISFLLFPAIIFSQSVVYKVYYGFFPAGKLKIFIQNNQVIVKGKSEGIVSWFYKYKLYMKYDLENPEKSILKEEENGKRRIYDFKRILKKKAWLPLVINILLKNSKIQKTLKVGNYTVALKRVKRNNYFFVVTGSKKTKEIILKRWYKNSFPREIVIKTTKGEIRLEKVND